MFNHRKKLSLQNEKILTEYVAYLTDVCGVTKGTIYNRTYNARLFLMTQEKKNRKDVSEVTPEHIKQYMFKVADRYERTTLQNVTSTLRSFFRYLHLKGQITETLMKAVPRMPKWTLKDIPDHMTEGQVDQLLKSFDRNSSVGKRNYAMAMLLTHLGLRSCEVSNIQLEDIDWKNGILKIRNSKCRRVDQLPLPKEVGEAVFDYIKNGRLKTEARDVFVCHRARRGEPISPKTVQGSMTYRFKLHKMRMPRYGSHIIRRTVAGQLIQKGATLKEIADVLRHRNIDTTKIYTKIDLPTLREVAMEWPWAVIS